MGTSFPAGEKILLGRKITDMISHTGQRQAFTERDSAWRRLTATALSPTDSAKFMEEVARSFHGES